GHGTGDHRFQHLGCDHDRLAGAARVARHLLLQPGYLLDRHLDAEIAARHHQCIGLVQDLAEPVDRLRLLDLGHNGSPSARDLLRLGDIFGPLDEGERHPIDTGVEPRFEIGTILWRQRREWDRRVGQAYALAVAELAADLHARENTLAVRLERD